MMFMNKKILFVQFRTDASGPHERECVREMLDVPEDRLAFISAIHDPLPEVVPADVAGVILGGSGEFYLTQDHGKGAWREKTTVFIDLLIENNIPLLGICFGFQFLALSQGAQIVNDPTMAEVGAFDLTLLPEAKEDVLFGDAPKTFLGQLGHKETIVDLPDRLIPLVRSERVACEAFRVAGKPAWGVLFHTELNRDRMCERLDLFPDYAGSPEEAAKKKESIKDTPEAAQIKHRFVAFALGGK
jgi:GMP synthase (glutamine-hydrolysing)